LDIRFAEPREGGPIAIAALAEPHDAPDPHEAAALIDFLLQPAIAAEATASIGLTSAEAAAPAETFRVLWPVGIYDAKLVPVIEREWARTRAPQQPERKPQVKTANKPASKPTRTKR
jgi:spermidine/putrescine-binding protein